MSIFGDDPFDIWRETFGARFSEEIIKLCAPCVTDSSALLSDVEREILLAAAWGGSFDDAAPATRNFCSVPVSLIATSILGRPVPPEAFWRSLCRKGWVKHFWNVVWNRDHILRWSAYGRT